MKEYLIDQLSEYLYEKGFVFEKKTYRFTKVEKERACSIRLVFVHNINVFIYYEIRFNLVEKLIDAFYNRKSRPLDPTIFISTGDLLVETSLYKFPIGKKEAAHKSAESIINIIKDLAFNYFTKYRTLDDLHELLNKMPFEPIKIRNDKYHNEVIDGFFRGILTAKLLNKNIKVLVHNHLAYLTNNSYGAENVNHYMNFIQWLEAGAGGSVSKYPHASPI